MLCVNECFNLQDWALCGGSERIAEHFHELVPDMALEFPFELDKFQKEVFYCCKFYFAICLY